MTASSSWAESNRGSISATISVTSVAVSETDGFGRLYVIEPCKGSNSTNRLYSEPKAGSLRTSSKGPSNLAANSPKVDFSALGRMTTDGALGAVRTRSAMLDFVARTAPAFLALICSLWVWSSILPLASRTGCLSGNKLKVFPLSGEETSRFLGPGVPSSPRVLGSIGLGSGGCSSRRLDLACSIINSPSAIKGLSGATLKNAAQKPLRTSYAKSTVSAETPEFSQKAKSVPLITGQAPDAWWWQGCQERQCGVSGKTSCIL